MIKKNAFAIGLGIIILIGLFLLFKPKSAIGPVPTGNGPFANPTSIATDSANLVTKPNHYDFVIENKKLVSGPKTISVKQNTTLTLSFLSDEAEEVHIHGYDKSIELLPNQKVAISFNTILTGRFEFELEQSETVLGVIEVQP